MEIKKIHAVFWSAAGSTKSIVMAVAKAASQTLSCPLEERDLTLPFARAQTYAFLPTDLVILGTPTYAGRVPNKVSPYLADSLRGNGALCAAVVTYGNRSFDNALAELCDLAEKDGFHTISAAVFACQHAFAPALAPGRPNGQDLAHAALFGQVTAEKSRDIVAIPAPVTVPGVLDAPYYIPKGLDGEPAKFLKAKPKTDADKCTLCGKCAAVCPMGAIDGDNVFEVPGVCIKCQACVRACPVGAKFFDDPAFLSHKAMLEQTFTVRKENEVFF